MAWWLRLAAVLAGLAVYGWSLGEPGAVLADLSKVRGAGGPAFQPDGTTSVVTGLEVMALGWVPALLLHPVGLAWVGIPAYLLALGFFLARVDGPALTAAVAALLLPLVGALATRLAPFPVGEGGLGFARMDHLLMAFWLSLLGPASVAAGAGLGLVGERSGSGAAFGSRRPMGRWRYLLPFGLSWAAIPVIVLGSLFWPGSGGLAVPVALLLAAAAFAVGLVTLLVFVHRIWCRLPPEYRPRAPQATATLLIVPIFNLVWQFKALPGWARSFARYRMDRGEAADERIQTLGCWACILNLACFVPVFGILAGIAAVGATMAFMDASIRQLNGEAA